jgi:hypothetical protein
MQILAGAQKRLKWQDGEFVAAADGDWVIKSLNYFEYQELHPLTGAEFLMGAITRGLVAVPEGATVAEFIAAPLPPFVHPLAAAVMEHTRGN